jgi:hypothetical protein
VDHANHRDFPDRIGSGNDVGAMLVCCRCGSRTFLVGATWFEVFAG